jgi:hypothetical protein
VGKKASSDRQGPYLVVVLSKPVAEKVRKGITAALRLKGIVRNDARTRDSLPT